MQKSTNDWGCLLQNSQYAETILKEKIAGNMIQTTKVKKAIRIGPQSLPEFSQFFADGSINCGSFHEPVSMASTLVASLMTIVDNDPLRNNRSILQRESLR